MSKKQRNFLPCRECGKTHTNPRSSSICPKCGEIESKRNAEELAARPVEPEYVSVPKELLAMVLDQAEMDSHALEQEWAFHLKEGERLKFEGEREKIYELRNVAGIEE